MPGIPRPINPARDWSDIVALYSRIKTPWATAMAQLVSRLREEGFVAAGLFGTTSMAELLLGRSSDIVNNPHLRIRPSKEFAELIYDDGSEPPWTIQVGYEELFERVRRILVKRARWFQVS